MLDFKKGTKFAFGGGGNQMSPHKFSSPDINMKGQLVVPRDVGSVEDSSLMITASRRCGRDAECEYLFNRQNVKTIAGNLSRK